MYFFCFFVQLFLLVSNLHADNCPTIQTHLDEIVACYFSEVPKDKITVSPLIGGHSNTTLLLEINSKNFVLRIKEGEASIESLKRELYAMQEAAKIGIAPNVLVWSKDYRAILMEYIQGGTVTVEQSKLPENCAKIANTLRAAHAIQKNPHFEENTNQNAAGCYYEICHVQKIKGQLDKALAMMWEYSDKLERFEANKVNVHGELNNRNIFLADQNAIFIDWEYTAWDDPFSDLSYLALRLDYNPAEELLLLKCYLKHEPSSNELERYDLAKKINLSQLCIFFHYFSLKLNHNKIELDDQTPVKEWSYYMSVFSDQQDDEQALPQFYYDLARSCFNQAQKGLLK